LNKEKDVAASSTVTDRILPVMGGVCIVVNMM